MMREDDDINLELFSENVIVAVFGIGERGNAFELGPRDAVFIPETGQYEILSFSAPANAMLGVAPRYLP